MKKIISILAMLLVSINIHAQLNIYTEYNPGTQTLSYYYDKFYSGYAYQELYNGNLNELRFAQYYDKVQKVVIDPSMKDAVIYSMRRMFYGGCDLDTNTPHYLYSLLSIEGLENLNTTYVTDMSEMFLGCQSLTSLDLSSFNTINVRSTKDMFSMCRSLTTLDISSFKIDKINDMRGMFQGCSNLTTIWCYNDWSNTTAYSANMFLDSEAIVGDKGTTYNKDFKNATYARPDGGPENPGYFTAETMTGLKGLKDRRDAKEAIYNLAGQRLNKPTRGINIIDGKRVVIKCE